MTVCTDKKTDFSKVCPGCILWGQVLEQSDVTFATADMLKSALTASNGEKVVAGNNAKTCLDPRIARVLLALVASGQVSVGALADGSHPATSAYYSGTAVDIAMYRFMKLGKTSAAAAQEIKAICMQYGASEKSIYNINFNCGAQCNAYPSSVHCEFN